MIEVTVREKSQYGTWFLWVYFILATLCIQNIANSKPDNHTFLKTKNPFTVLGLDPMGYDPSDAVNTYNFWQRIFARSEAQDAPSWNEIETAYKNLKDPTFLKTYLENRLQMVQQGDAYFFSVGTQELSDFIKRRASELDRGLYESNDIERLAGMVFNLHAGFKRDLVDFPKARMVPSISDHFDKKMRDLNVKLITSLLEANSNTNEALKKLKRLPVLQKDIRFYRALFKELNSQTEIGSYSDFLNTREWISALAKTPQEQDVIDRAISETLAQNQNAPSFLIFVNSLSPSELKKFRYFAPFLGDLNCPKKLDMFLARKAG